MNRSMKKEISELQVMERKCLSERTNEYNTLVNKLKSIRHKVRINSKFLTNKQVSSLKQHTENIEEGDQYIRILQKIIDSTQVYFFIQYYLLLLFSQIYFVLRNGQEIDMTIYKMQISLSLTIQKDLKN